MHDDKSRGSKGRMLEFIFHICQVTPLQSMESMTVEKVKKSKKSKFATSAECCKLSPENLVFFRCTSCDRVMKCAF